MTLTPFDVATHWPWLRRRLLLDRTPAMDRALTVLAHRQVDAGGEPVVFGTAVWAQARLSPGEGRAAAKALVLAEQRGVVERIRSGSGRRGNVWSFRPSIDRWVLPWASSRRDAERAVVACSYRAACVVVAQHPGQSILLSRNDVLCRLPETDHLRRPGVFPVDVRDNDTSCATTTRTTRENPVDVRDYGTESGAPSPSSGEAKASLLLSEEESACVQEFKLAIVAACQLPTFGGPLAQLERLCQGMTLDEARAIIATLGPITHPRSGVAEVIAPAVELHRRTDTDRRQGLVARLQHLEHLLLEGYDDYAEEAATIRTELGLVAAEALAS